VTDSFLASRVTSEVDEVTYNQSRSGMGIVGYLKVPQAQTSQYMREIDLYAHSQYHI
jgi:hypothetical protein